MLLIIFVYTMYLALTIRFMLYMHCDLRFVRTTAYLKAKMEVCGKSLIGLGLETTSQRDVSFMHKKL